MSYQNPLGGVPDPFGYRVEGTQQGRQGGNLPQNEPPDNKGLLGHLLQKIQRSISRILEKFSEPPNKESVKQEHLLALKTYLEILKIEDRSQDVAFLNELSKSWNHTLEGSLEFNEQVLALFNLFIKKINHYPENQQYTFGYYLTEYAGQKWIPFPYMELVQKIHKEHELNPSGSALTEWVRLLEDALRLLNQPFAE